jgi:AcrR family transcriptional regulator
LIEDPIVSFEKPGRPRNDPAEERLRIYAAALPVIRRDGARARMDALARSANMSVGGIYHYFASKRDLLLHGLNPEALALACHTFDGELQKAAEAGVEGVIDVYVDRTVYISRLIEPAVAAALELGVGEIRSRLAQTLRQDADGLIQILSTVTPGLNEELKTELAAALRRTLLALSLDPQATEGDHRTQLTALLRGFLELNQPSLAEQLPALRSRRVSLG